MSTTTVTFDPKRMGMGGEPPSPYHAAWIAAVAAFGITPNDVHVSNLIRPAIEFDDNGSATLRCETFTRDMNGTVVIDVERNAAVLRSCTILLERASELDALIDPERLR